MDPLGTAVRTPIDTAPEARFQVTDVKLTGSAGLTLVARVASQDQEDPRSPGRRRSRLPCRARWTVNVETGAGSAAWAACS